MRSDFDGHDNSEELKGLWNEIQLISQNIFASSINLIYSGVNEIISSLNEKLSNEVIDEK